jgi:hypothetical protein
MPLRIRLIVILFVVASATIAVAQQPYEDDGTNLPFNGVQVHVCSGGGVMIGLDAQFNRFLCLSDMPVGPPFLDTSTQGNYETAGNQNHPTHVCPGGAVMVGFHQGFNWLICAYPTIWRGINSCCQADGVGGHPSEIVEPLHTDRITHYCPPVPGRLDHMAGVDLAANVFMCRLGFTDAEINANQCNGPCQTQSVQKPSRPQK